MGLPGWNSIQATGIFSNFFFYASIGALILLGLAEVFSHRYGERHDLLVAQQQRAEKDASDGELARLHRDTAEANARALEAQVALEKFKAPRIIVNDKKFLEAIRKAPPPVSFRVRYVDSGDCAFSANILFAMLATTGGWSPTPGVFPVAPISKADAIDPRMWGVVSDTQAVGASSGTGITIIAKNADRTKGTPTIDALQDALVAELGPVVLRGRNATLPDGVLVIVVAPKT